MKDLYPELLSSNPNAKEQRLKNARIALKVRARVQPGETVTILIGERDGHAKGPNRLDAAALAQAAAEMGAYPLILDISEFVGTPRFNDKTGFEAARQAIIHSDVVLGFVYRFESLGLNVNGSADPWLVGDRKQRWVSFQPYMDLWDITEEEVAAIEPTTKKLLSLVEQGHSFRVTSPAGTDFTFETLSAKHILGIFPIYAEVAIMPQFGSGSGVVVVDGATQRDVRPCTETDREPLRVVIENNEAVSWSGAPQQVARLEAFMNASDVKGKFVDEVGLPTTRIASNNLAWPDGTHQSDTIHIALGNNAQRDEVVHGVLHMDMEVRNPTFYIDGKPVIKDQKFLF